MATRYLNTLENAGYELLVISGTFGHFNLIISENYTYTEKIYLISSTISG
jgi:hypothetical protein